MRRFWNDIILAGLAVFAVGTFGLAAQTKSGSAVAKNPEASTPKSIATGQAVFQKYCRFCHGADAKGDGPQAPKDTHPPNLTDEKWEHGQTDGEIFAVIKDGVGPKYDMKGFNSKLTPQEMWSVVNYLRSIGTKNSTR